MKISYRFVLPLALFAAVVATAEPDQQNGSTKALIDPDQEETPENGNGDDSTVGRFFSWIAGEDNNGSSLRGGRRNLHWWWTSGSGNCKQGFFTSCSSRDDFSTGNQNGNGNNPGRPTTTRPPLVPIPTILTSNSEFSTLVELASVPASVIPTLSGDGPFTVFAPTNVAFSFYDLNNAKASADLEKILAYHVVPGTYLAKDLSDGTQLTTVEGQNITVHIANGVSTLNCANPPNPASRITMVDMVGSNGVVHTIDWPLNPFVGNQPTC